MACFMAHGCRADFVPLINDFHNRVLRAFLYARVYIGILGIRGDSLFKGALNHSSIMAGVWPLFEGGKASTHQSRQFGAWAAAVALVGYRRQCG